MAVVRPELTVSELALIIKELNKDGLHIKLRRAMNELERNLVKGRDLEKYERKRTAALRKAMDETRDRHEQQGLGGN